MEKQRKIKMLSLLLLFVSVIGLTVAFAAMSRTLTINGTTELEASKWDITMGNVLDEKDGKYFTSIVDWDDVSKTGDCAFCHLYTEGNAKFIKEPVINGTTVSGYEVSLTKPGDMARFGVGIANEGTIDAKIESFTVSKPVCTSTVGNEAEAKLVCDNLRYSVYDPYDYSVMEGEEFPSGKDGEIVVVLEYTGDALPTNDVEISNLSAEINFVQK